MLRNQLQFLWASGVVLSLVGWLSNYEPYDYHLTSISADNYILHDTIDTIPKKYKPNRFSTYSFPDRQGDPYSTRRSKSLLNLQPSNIKTEVKRDTATNTYTIEEKIGESYYRPPSLMAVDELDALKDKEAADAYWRKTGAGASSEDATTNPRGFQPRIPLGNKLLGKIFKGDYVEFKPTGFANLDFGYKRQRILNPAIPAERQSTGVFDFDPHANVSVTGQIGERLKLGVSFDTKSSFEFDNQFKTDYTGDPEEIIQKIEFGNVSFPLPTSLITGSQNLFGIRTELKFGRLRINSVFSQQRSSADQVKIQGGGAQVRRFEIRASDYEENKHFFLSQFHRNIYEPALQTMPIINSGVVITRVEVFITNRTNTTQNLRSVIGFTDLGEGNPFRTGNGLIGTGQGNVPAQNPANALFNNISQNPSVRDAQVASDYLASQGLQKGTDFELLRASKRLEPGEFTFHPQLGYISLNAPLRNDEVLAVAYEYTYNGQAYKVGELSEEYVNRPPEQAVFLKLLRPSTIRTDLPTWDLMMKNVYSLGAGQINAQNFQLRVIYRDDITGLDNPTLQEGERTKDVQLIKIFGLDQLNPRGDRVIDGQGNIVTDNFGRPLGDGNFDFVEGLTINAAQGRIIFPVLEPFGVTLRQQFNPATELNLINKYVFEELYNGTKNDAQNNFAGKNKFFIKGQFEGTASNTAALPGINIPQGSVTVRAGGILLTENQDYVVNYSTGQVTITNEAILNSGKEITIDFEKADFFNLQTRTFWGTRLDYAFNEDFNIGATILNLRERPVLTRVAIGSEALNNTMIGFDMNLKKESRFLTRAVDALPLIQTKEKSIINFAGEVAQLRPGAAKLSGAVSFIDDFEGAESPIDLGSSPNLRWKLGATPQGFRPNAVTNPLELGYRRALMAWYNIDNSVFYRPGPNTPSNISSTDLENHYMRPISPQEIFPNRQFENIVTNQNTFDIAYFPSQRGPFNYNPALNPDASLPNPASNFGAITRAITSEVDFDNANIEYIEFWMLDPFIKGPRGRVIVDGPEGVENTTGGDLLLHLGNISEDVLSDGRHFFENGLPITPAGEKEQTPWGFVPGQQYVNNAFNNTSGARPNQDVGLDGVRNTEEADFFADFLNSLPGSASPIISEDVSGDNFRYYLDGFYDGKNAKIIERYKAFNNTENNSPENNGRTAFIPAGTNIPDNEDLNADNTLSDVEAYYQYRIPLREGNLEVGENYIVDKIEVRDPQVTQNGQDQVTWYQFRIPVREFEDKIGSIDGFKSIRYMRLVLTNFQQPVVLRMAQFQMISNQWRRFLGNLQDKGFQEPGEPYSSSFVVSTVNLEENASNEEGLIPYTIPPGAIRDVDVTSINQRQLPEQSLQVCVEDLRNRDARAAFKNVNLNLLYYKRLQMYLHANTDDPTTRNDELSATIRLGTDFTDNYYEIEVPLLFTTPSDVSASPNQEALQRAVWKLENELDIAISDIVGTKVERNNQGIRNIFVPYTRQIGRYRVTVVGNPDASSVLTLMLGIRNPNLPSDDQQPKSACVWFNELRATGFDKTNGMAAVARLNMQLADFASITATGGFSTAGFGSINTRIAERALSISREYDLQGTFALDKFTPQKWGLRLPVFLGYQRKNISPEFDPLDKDVRLEQSLQKFDEQGQRNYRSLVEDNETRRSINFTNIRKVKTDATKKAHLWDISNFAFTWAYSDTRRTSIYVAEYLQQNWKTALAYTYTNQPKAWEPFKESKAQWLNSPWLKFIKDFNLSFGPTSIGVRGDLDRTFIRTQLRSGDLQTQNFEPFYEKYFNFNRVYNVQWALTKSINLTYDATANAIIDEPVGEISTSQNKEVVRENILKLGRMKEFNQRVGATYRIPLDKFPITDWISADAGYNASYRWSAASLGLERTLGNTVQNTRDQNLRGRLDLVKLYNKSKTLQKVNNYRPTPKGRQPPKVTPTPPKGPSPVELKTDSTLSRKEKRKLRREKRRKERANKQLKAPTRALLRTLMSVRNVQVTYSKQESTILPGVIDAPRYFGLADNSSPGLNFILGDQNPDIRFQALNNGWMVIPPANNANQALIQNVLFTQNLTENISGRAEVEPLKDLRITLDAKVNRGSTYQENFRFDTLSAGYVSFSPNRRGTYLISIISIKTAFESSDNTIGSKTFETFSANRQVFQERFIAQNPNVSSDTSYRDRSQDVLTSAFLAAYTGSDPRKAKLSAFPQIPLPNWRIEYSGLSKIPGISKIFQTATVTHAYTSEYRIGNYTSALDYQDPSLLTLNNDERTYINPVFLGNNGELIPVFVLGQVQISERFTPLLGMNVRTRNNMNIRLDYNRERDIGLNLANAEVTELRNTSVVIGFGFSKKNLVLPFRDRNRNRIVLKNNTDFRMDFTIRDTKTFQRKLDEEDVVTSGNYNFQIKPNVTYTAGKNLTLQIYFERTINTPAISTAFPIRTFSGGFQIRYSFNQ